MPPYPGKDYEPEQKIVTPISGGVDYSKPGSDIDDKALTDVLNLQYYRGILRSDTGYAVYRQPGLLGIPQGVFQFILTSGELDTLLLTTTTLYRDNGVEWEFVGDGTHTTTLSATTAAGSDTFHVTSAAGLANGQHIGIRLSDGSQLQTTITGVSGTTITAALPVPVGLSADSGGQFVVAPMLNGDVSFQPDGITWPVTNLFIFTNGVDNVQKYDGTNCQDLGGSPPTCLVLVEFHGFLILANTSDGLGAHPLRLQWSDVNNPEAWGIMAGSLAGFVDLTDTEDPILGLEPLGPWIIVYRQASIMRRSYIGSLDQLFYDEYTVFGVGVVSTACIADTGATHVFIGEEGIFRYSGGYDLEDVGQNVFDKIFAVDGNFNNTLASRTFAFYVAEIDEVWMFYASTDSDDYPDTLVRFDQGSEGWWVRKFANKFNGFGFIESEGGRTWDQATQAWSDDTSTWTSRSKTDQAPLTVFTDPVNMRTVIYDYITSTDDGVIISTMMMTKDFTSPNYLVRFDGFIARGTGNNILVEISMDTGVSWITLGVLNFGLTLSTQRVNNQITSNQFRLRLTGADPGFSLNLFRVDFFEETPW
jgi:hypothetical protein